ncbi:MAG: hypothetical protein JWM78_1880 [Verrucomicrobiaceae bacterium]|nr:hypothetical protein [Verrucomicrobiaceae bacterium]
MIGRLLTGVLGKAAMNSEQKRSTSCAALIRMLAQQIVREIRAERVAATDAHAQKSSTMTHPKKAR